MFLVKFLIAVVLTELLTELAIKSVIFRPLRDKIKGLGYWFKEFISCGYCFSVWAATGVAFLFQLGYNLTGYFYLDVLLTALVVHRCSNYLHNFNDCWLDKYYNTFRVNTDKSDE